MARRQKMADEQKEQKTENAERAERLKQLQQAEKAAAEDNATRTGVGTRLFTGMTRGKGTQVISFEQWDDAQPETLPKSIAQFMEVTGISEQADVLARIIRGDNALRYEAASDPLAEHVGNSWAADVSATFRAAVRNYSRGLGVSLEDAVNIIKPGFTAKFGE